MVEGRWRPRARSAPEHLPPLELLPYVIERKGRNIALERFETPLDEYGVPDVRKTMQRLGSLITYDSQYEAQLNLTVINLHHLVHKKYNYNIHGHHSHQVNYREGSSVKAEMYIPFHNLEHFLGIEPPIPNNDVMKQRAREQQDTVQLYRLGNAALWLDEMGSNGQASYQTAEEYILKKGFRGDGLGRKFLPSHNSFLDLLESRKPGEMGIMPDIEELAKLSLKDAVSRLKAIVATDAALTAEETSEIIMNASRLATQYDRAA